jgi:cobalt-precorrin-5B (C1)-methyltransferase
LTEKGAEAWVTKDGGDDTDVTNGAVIVSSVEVRDEGGITVLGGPGVGVVTRPGLPVPPGRAAINAGPMALIRKSLETEFPSGKGASVSISIPDGEELAKRTYNPRLGIVGGLPIVGAAGAAHHSALDDAGGAMKSDLQNLSESGASAVCLVPGNYGRRMAIILGVPEVMIVNINNLVGDALSMAGNLGFEKLVMIGQIGKLSKIAAGSLDTHSSKSDGRLEALAAYAALYGANREMIGEILNSTMADEVASRIARTEWGAEALSELVRRVVRTALSAATGIVECACQTFSLPDRELSRTNNTDALIEEIKAEAYTLKRR